MPGRCAPAWSRGDRSGAAVTERVPVRADLADLEPYGAPQLDVPVRLNTNETPYPPPPELFARLAEQLAELPLHRYPDRRAWALRTALGQRFGLGPERVWAASGSNEVLQHLLQAYGGPGRRALVLRPGYAMYPPIARVALTEVVEADLDADLRCPPELAAEAVARHDPDVVLVANPNNPTGLILDAAAITALHDHSRALVVLDEAYVEFADPSGSAVAQLEALPRLVIVRTFSKAWRLAGARLGYLLGPEWVVDDLRRVRLPYHLDALVQQAGIVAVELAEQVTAHIAEIIAEREALRAALESLPGVEVWPSAANFLLLRTGVDDLFDRLLEQGVLVRDFSRRPRLEGCLRVTVGTPTENARFLEALQQALQAAEETSQ